MTWAEAAAEISRRWGQIVRLPPDDQHPDDDELAFWAAVEELVTSPTGGKAYVEEQHPRDEHGRWSEAPGIAVVERPASWTDDWLKRSFVSRMPTWRRGAVSSRGEVLVWNEEDGTHGDVTGSLGGSVEWQRVNISEDDRVTQAGLSGPYWNHDGRYDQAVVDRVKEALRVAPERPLYAGLRERFGKSYVEAEHPRDAHGRWSDVPGSRGAIKRALDDLPVGGELRMGGHRVRREDENHWRIWDADGQPVEPDWTDRGFNLPTASDELARRLLPPEPEEPEKPEEVRGALLVPVEGEPSEPDYRIQHTAPGPGYGSTADDMEATAPDFYSHPEWYRTGNDKADRESLNVLMRIRGKPNATVTIYRSTPVAEINSGDWISLSKTAATEEGMHPTDPEQDMPVMRARVRANQIWWDGNSINEFGYSGPRLGLAKAYDPNEPRDAHGRWTRTGGGSMQEITDRLAKRGIRFVEPGENSAWTAEEMMEVARTVEGMAETYPGLKKTLTEIVPRSSGEVPIQVLYEMINSGSVACYNPKTKAVYLADDKMIPYGGLEGFAAPATASGPRGIVTHEIGHALTGLRVDMVHHPYEEDDEWRRRLGTETRDMLSRARMKFSDVAPLSRYAASHPVEAVAELTSTYHLPGYRDDMDPELRKKAKTLFDALEMSA